MKVDLLAAAFVAAALVPVAALAQAPPPGTGRIQKRTLTVEGVGKVTYGILVPNSYRAEDPPPLILALHPGGPRTPYYGSAFVRQVVQPALADLGAIIVAPDCPAKSWADASADRAVMELLNTVTKEHTIDRRRVLVTGFSMGGRGTWFMASRHADLFTAAIPMAASTGDEPPERLAAIPTYVIHSRADEVIPFEPAERNARELERLGRVIRFEALDDIGHFQMGGYVDALERAGRWVAERWKSAAAR
jgi:predicted peptidase